VSTADGPAVEVMLDVVVRGMRVFVNRGRTQLPPGIESGA
jgi:hypothetical protein